MGEEHTLNIGSVLWVDSSEIALLNSQSWFNELRKQLNEQSKVKINFGLFSFEHQGSIQTKGYIDDIKIAASILQKISCTSMQQLKKEIESLLEDINDGFLVPSLLTIEGQFGLVADRVKVFAKMLKYVANRVGYECNGNISETFIAEKKSDTEKIFPLIVELTKCFGLDVDDFVKDNFNNPEIITLKKYKGSEYAYFPFISSDMSFSDQIDILLPVAAVNNVTSTGLANYRLAGWVEFDPHKVKFVMRVFAIGAVNRLYLPNKANSADAKNRAAD